MKSILVDFMLLPKTTQDSLYFLRQWLSKRNMLTLESLLRAGQLVEFYPYNTKLPNAGGSHSIQRSCSSIVDIFIKGSLGYT